jgi:hypothetical protein
MAKAPDETVKQVNVGFVIKDLGGAAVQFGSGEGPTDLTLGHMLIQIVLAPPPQGAKPYTIEQQLARYSIARDIQAAFAKNPPVIELDTEYVEELAARVAAGFAPGIAGPALEELLK